MRKGFPSAVALGAASIPIFLSLPAAAQVTPTADSAIAPVRFSPTVPPPGFTPTFLQFNTNAINSLANGGGTVGNPATDPAAYKPQGTINRGDFFSSFEGTNTTFPSFKGVANPAAPFDQQFGNALIFPLRLVSTTDKFRLSNLDNIASSDDPGNTIGGDISHLAANRNYSATRVGIDYGPDGQRGTADDIRYDADQPGSTPINELLYSGVAVFEEATDFGGTAQQNLDQSIAKFYQDNPLTKISNTYLLKDDAGTLLVEVTKTVTVVPEPTSIAVIGSLGLGLFARRRRA